MSSGSTVIVASAMLITSAHRSPELNTPYSQPSGQPSKISPARKNMGFELPHVNRPGRTRWNQRLVWLFELASAVRTPAARAPGHSRASASSTTAPHRKRQGYADRKRYVCGKGVKVGVELGG